MAQPALENALESADADVRAEAAWAIGRIGRGKMGSVGASEVKLQTLCADDPEVIVRLRSAGALCMIDRGKADEARSFLEESSRGDNEAIRSMAWEILKEIDSGGQHTDKRDRWKE